MRARVVAVLGCAALAGACTQEPVDEKFENLKLTAALLQMRDAPGAGMAMPLSRLPQIDAGSTVCVLGAHVNEASGELAPGVNAKLAQAHYRPGDDRWALVQLRTDGKLEMAVVRQRERQLAGIQGGGGERGSCAKVADVSVVQGHDKELLFLFAAPRPAEQAQEAGQPADVSLRMSYSIDPRVSTPRLGPQQASPPPAPVPGSQR